MIKTVTSLLLGLLLSLFEQAQPCGTAVTTKNLKIIQELRTNPVHSRDLGDELIPVAYHIIMEDDRSIPCSFRKKVINWTPIG
jgi:hypothetical protein